MKYFSIYFKKNQGGGTQVLNKISETLDAEKIYLFNGSLKIFLSTLLKSKKISII